MNKQRITQWHPAFYGAMQLELAEDKMELDFAEEVILNMLPLRLDMLVIKKKRAYTIRNEIGSIFQKYNILEYKSPDDELDMNTFLKGVVYALLYKIKEPHLDEILLSDITLSFIRERKPIKLLKKLIEKNFLVEEKYPGIYYINRTECFPIQIIVTKELDFHNHIWLKSLSSRMSQKEAVELLEVTKRMEEPDEKKHADSVWEVVVTQNKEIIQKLMEDEDMCKALAEMMKPEIDAAFNNGFDNGFGNGAEEKGIRVFQNMISRGFSKEEAQALAEISDELVERALKK